MLLVRFLQSVILVCLVGIILVLFQAGAAETGPVIFGSDYRAPGATEALTFDNPESLKTFQSELQSERPDFYSVRATKGTVIQVKLTTARLVGQDNFRPALALFGPGLPPPDKNDLRLLSFSVPAGLGLILSADTTTDKPNVTPALPNHLDDPWTQTSYWERQSLLSDAPQDGLYYIAVFSRNAQSGKYALAVGDKKKAEAGLRETLGFPVTWGRLHLWFGDYWWPGLAVGLAGLGLLGLLVGYGRLLGRRVGLVGQMAANTRRSELLHKRIKRRTRPLKPVQKKATRPAFVQTTLQRFQTEAQTVQRQPAEQAATLSTLASPPFEDNLLTGPRWESLSAPTLPADMVMGNSNGHGHHPVVNIPATTRPKNSRRDGLSQWSERYRPTTKD